MHARLRTALVAALSFLAGSVVGPVPATAGVTAQSTSTTTITTGWVTKERTLADGRRYFVDVPTCSPATEAACKAHLDRPRQVMVFLHHATGAEDPTTATNHLAWFHNFERDTLFVYGVSKGGSRAWDARICCTQAPVDDVGYLVLLVDDLATAIPVNRNRVGLFGVSNGGMLAERAACERPDRFPAAASLAGTYDGPCAVGLTRIRQWHGAQDKTVPVNGGTSWILGRWVTFPPAATLSTRMASGSQFGLEVLPGYVHALPGWVHRDAVLWVDRTMPR